MLGGLLLQVVSKRKEKNTGTHSPGKALVVYEINKHVFPTAPSPTTTPGGASGQWEKGEGGKEERRGGGGGSQPVRFGLARGFSSWR